ncbi:MAG: J domain-containing protein [Thermodesulfovibrionales bacterium]
MRNYYKVLNISENASPTEIREAYLKLVKEWHPDRNPHTPLSDEMMKMYNEAYETLSDPEERLNYDISSGIRPTLPEHEPTAAQPFPSYHMPTEQDWKEWKEAKYQSYSVLGLEKFLAAVLIPIGTILLLLYGYSIIVVKSAVNWPATKGSIINSKVDHAFWRYREFRPERVYAQISYEYSVDDVKYNNWELLGWFITKEQASAELDKYFSDHKDKLVTVHYKPGHPETAILNVEAAFKSPAAYVPETSKSKYLFGIFPLCIGLVCLLDLLGVARIDILEYMKRKLQGKDKSKETHNHQIHRMRNKAGSFFSRGKLPRR